MSRRLKSYPRDKTKMAGKRVKEIWQEYWKEYKQESRILSPSGSETCVLCCHPRGIGDPVWIPAFAGMTNGSGNDEWGMRE